MTFLRIYFTYFIIISCIIKGVFSIECYSCNTRDHENECDDLENFKNSTLTKTCEETCGIVKGQWGNENGHERKYMLWRGCGPIECHQGHALCCHCKDDFCNFGNVCFNAGHIRTPGILLIYAEILHLYSKLM